MIRLLNKNDTELLKNVLPESKVKTFSDSYLLGLKNYLAFGLFRDNNLVGVTTVYYSDVALEWFLLKTYAEKAEDLELLIELVCKHFEDKKIYRFFWLDAEYYIDFMKNYIPTKYLHFLEGIIEPHGLPLNLKHYHILYDMKLFPVKTFVYMSVLPDEFRKLS